MKKLKLERLLGYGENTSCSVQTFLHRHASSIAAAAVVGSIIIIIIIMSVNLNFVCGQDVHQSFEFRCRRYVNRRCKGICVCTRIKWEITR